MSDKPYEAGEKAAAKKDADDKPVEAAYEPLPYGTHSLPKKFWTTNESPILKDPAFIARRAAKNARHLDNRAKRADQNQRGHR